MSQDPLNIIPRETPRESFAKKYKETITEIAQLEDAIARANGLGHTSSSQGIASSYPNVQAMQDRLDSLRSQRDEMIRSVSGRGMGVNWIFPIFRGRNIP